MGFFSKIIATIASVFTSSGTAVTNVSYENIMYDSIKNNNVKITEVAMLGAHDAFTNRISSKSNMNTNEGGAFDNSIVDFVGKGVIADFAKAQDDSAATMLKKGVRYFEARITKLNGKYYTAHGLVSDKIDYYLKDIVNFLGSHKGEVIVLDIQHFYASGSKSDYSATASDYTSLMNYIGTIKNSSNKSILDYCFYDSTSDKISSLTYGILTKNKTTSGVLMLAKNNNNKYFYARDNEASYSKTSYKSIRSYWHNEVTESGLIDSIESEYKHINNYHSNYSNVLRVNQAQITIKFDKSLIKTIVKGDLLSIAKSTNKKIISSESRLNKWMKEMPIVMVDNATTNEGNFNQIINKNITNYNKKL